MIGHLGPRGSYQLLKDWLQQMGSEKVKVPCGFVSIGFDNEQRLLRNWLARGNNRSTVEVLTNVVCAAHDEKSKVQEDPSLHRRNWRQPSAEELKKVFDDKPDIFSSADIKSSLFEYMNERIAELVAVGQDDEVSKSIADEENHRAYLVCPSCNTNVERRLRNCPNCDIGNVRQAIARNEGIDVVSTERVRTHRPRTVPPGTTFHYFVDQSGSMPCLRRSSSAQDGSTSESISSDSCQEVPRAHVVPIEPYFVNPNSHEALRRLLRHIGQECGVKGVGGSEREWVSVCCDGLPYNLMRTVMLESRQDANQRALIAAGIPTVANLRKADLQQECLKRGLSRTGRVEELKQRLQAHVSSQLQSQEIYLPAPEDGEFDWVVCVAGGLHWEMKFQSVIDILWPFVYESFAISQGYTTPRQQDWCKSAKDHHRTFDEMSRFTDGVFLELLRPYVLQSDHPTVSGFFRWAEQYKKNLTFTFLLDLATRYCYSLFMFRRGMRSKNMPLLLEARRLLTPVIHARNHPGYQSIELYEETDRLAWPEELCQLMDKCTLLRRSVLL